MLPGLPALGRFALPELVRLVADPHREVRDAAIEYLSRTGYASDEAADEMMSLLRRTDQGDRDVTGSRTRMVRYVSEFPTMTSSISEQSNRRTDHARLIKPEREEAAHRVVEFLAELIRDDPDTFVRAEALRGISYLYGWSYLASRGRALLPTICAAVNDVTAPWLRAPAAEALQAITGERSPSRWSCDAAK
jgi:hypothetical protein